MKRSLAVNPDVSMNKAAISLNTNLHVVIVYHAFHRDGTAK